MTAAVYRGYDQEALDRQLNLRARHPDHPDYFERWARASAEVRRTRDCRLDLAYGQSAGQRLDLFPAATPSPGGTPLLAFIHGGYWQSLDKGDFSYLAPPYLDAGIAFASLNYDLAPAARIEEMVDQVRRALAWLYRNAGDHGLDAERLFVAGHSAGGHLAVLALHSDWRDLHDLPRDLVKGACSVSGLYDLEPVRLSYHQEILAIEAVAVERHSPIRQRSRPAGPLICAVGSDESEIFLQQQEDYLAACRGGGLLCTEVPLPGRHHFDAVDSFGDPDHPLFTAVKALILEGKPAVSADRRVQGSA